MFSHSLPLLHPFAFVLTRSPLQPAYDTNAEHTTMAAADVLYEVMSIMVKKGPLSKMVSGKQIEEL
jgi:hypothetical protein